jgi:hypothetical protein
MRAQWGGQVIYYSLYCTVITLMPTIHCLICTKTATTHLSKALVYNSGNRQQDPRARAMYMHGVDRAERNKIESVCIWGGSSLGLTLLSTSRECGSLYYSEREEIITAPRVLLLLLAPAAQAKPSKLHPVENSIQLARIASPIIAMGIAIQIPCLECD